VGTKGAVSMAAMQDAERRNATVLFADLTGFSGLVEQRDPEEAYAALSACVKRLDGIARRHGGSVHMNLGDAIMAVFWDRETRSNDAGAAIAAAVEMRDGVDEFNREHSMPSPFGIHFGIDSGPVVALESSLVAGGVSLVGEVVNIAARLMELSPKGQVWVGERTYRAVHSGFRFRALDRVSL